MNVLEEYKVKCPHCTKEIAQVVNTQPRYGTMSHKAKYKFINCPHCGRDTFFTKTFKGMPTIIPTNDNLVFDHESSNIVDDTILCEVRIVKRKKV